MFILQELNSDNDADLLKLIRLGDHKAFKLVYRKYYRQLCYFAGSGYFIEEEPVEEIVLDAFMDVWKRKEELSSLPHLKNLLYLSVRTGCIDYLRTRQRQITHYNQFLETAGQQQHFESGRIEADLVSRIYDAVALLPGECKRIFEMLYLQDLKPQEVAEKLNISPSTVRSQKARAIILLRRALLPLILLLILCG